MAKSKKFTFTIIDNKGIKTILEGTIRINGYLEWDGLNEVDKLEIEAFDKVECEGGVYFSRSREEGIPWIRNYLYNHFMLGLGHNIYQAYTHFGIN